MGNFSEIPKLISKHTTLLQTASGGIDK